MTLKITDVSTTSKWGQPRLDIFGSVKDYQQTIPLHIDWLNYHGALYACRNWHYTGTMPASKTIKLGVWENGKYIGCVIYSRGANPRIGKPFNLQQTEICELTRIALRRHSVPVSRLISISLKMLRQLCPGMKLVLSYADMEQGHVGTVYQASNWYYLGSITSHVFTDGKHKVHGRTMAERRKRNPKNPYTPESEIGKILVRKAGLVRHKYIYPLDSSMCEILDPLSIPYPKK